MNGISFLERIRFVLLSREIYVKMLNSETKWVSTLVCQLDENKTSLLEKRNFITKEWTGEREKPTTCVYRYKSISDLYTGKSKLVVNQYYE